MALDAKRAAGRRRTYEARVESTMPKDPAGETTWREVQTALDEEIARLPERLRAFSPLLYRWARPCGGRQAFGPERGDRRQSAHTAHKLLAGRLARRSITLSAALGATALTGATARSAVPALLASSTAATAISLVSGSACADRANLSRRDEPGNAGRP